MFSLRYLLKTPVGYRDYIWMNVSLIKETKKAVLIMFDSRKEWLPKAWIWGIKHRRHYEGKKYPPVIARSPKATEAISIKISSYHWAKKFE